MVTTIISNDARLSRSDQLIAEPLKAARVLVGGVGMLGSWTTLGLARCAAHVTVFDPDTVEDVNSGNQAYHGGHIGRPKVDALLEMCAGLPVTGQVGMFPLGEAPNDLFPTLPPTDEPRPLVVVSGVDSFKARAELANYANVHKADVFVDTRALGEIAVVCIVPHDQLERYLSQEIIDDKDAPDVPCGMQGTSYTGMHIAARVITGLNAYFKHRRVPFIRVEDIGTGDTLRSEE